jgi:peptidoglycan/xylan/chitin deacetylase (PgdA/CDA1 family)
MDAIPNLVTVDLDDARKRSRGDVPATAERLLDAFANAGAKATFFAPESFAARNGAIARRIAEQGHEVACLTHQRPPKGKPYCASFTAELDAAREAIESATGVRVRGHRNVEFAVDYESEWTYDVLVERGLEFDSSRVPSRRAAEYGYQPVPRAAHAVRRWGGMLLEIPVSTTRIAAMRVRLGANGTLYGFPLVAWSALAADRQLRGESLVLRLRADELTPATVERAGRIAGHLQSTSVASALSQLHARAPIIDS